MNFLFFPLWKSAITDGDAGRVDLGCGRTATRANALAVVGRGVGIGDPLRRVANPQGRAANILPPKRQYVRVNTKHKEDKHQKHGCESIHRSAVNRLAQIFPIP